MFGALGHTRDQFYGHMITETRLHVSPYNAEFGKRAREFFEEAIETLHEEHLMVFHCVQLLLKLHKASCPEDSIPITDEKLEVAYKFFKDAITIRGDFLYYTESDAFLSHRLKGGGDLSEVK